MDGPWTDQRVPPSWELLTPSCVRDLFSVAIVRNWVHLNSISNFFGGTIFPSFINPCKNFDNSMSTRWFPDWLYWLTDSSTDKAMIGLESDKNIYPSFLISKIESEVSFGLALSSSKWNALPRALKWTWGNKMNLIWIFLLVKEAFI